MQGEIPWHKVWIGFGIQRIQVHRGRHGKQWLLSNGTWKVPVLRMERNILHNYCCISCDGVSLFKNAGCIFIREMSSFIPWQIRYPKCVVTLPADVLIPSGDGPLAYGFLAGLSWFLNKFQWPIDVHLKWPIRCPKCRGTSNVNIKGDPSQYTYLFIWYSALIYQMI